MSLPCLESVSLTSFSSSGTSLRSQGTSSRVQDVPALEGFPQTRIPRGGSRFLQKWLMHHLPSVLREDVVLVTTPHVLSSTLGPISCGIL